MGSQPPQDSAIVRSIRPGGPPLPMPDVGLENTAGFFVPSLGRRKKSV
jgi:hypothetical protein